MTLAPLSSSAATGGGTAAESDETRAAILHSLEVERTVVEQLRAARPPTPDDDWSESGGDALPGAAHEVDLVEPAQLDATTTTVDDVDDTQQHEGESPKHPNSRETVACGRLYEYFLLIY